MKTWMSLIVLTLITFHTAFAAPVTNSFHEGEAHYLDPSLVVTKYLAVKAMELKGFSGSGLTKMQKSMQVLEKVVNSETFKNRVINFKNKKGVRAFASNNGMSNEQIYEHFMDGRENLLPDTAGEMNFYLKLYSAWWSKVVGWTNEDINTININNKFFKNYKPNEVAGNLAHEWTHKIGFDHTSAAEHDSAPYAIGYVVEELAAKVLSGQMIQ